MFVDDNYLARSLGAEQLKHYGYLVSQFPNAEKAYLSLKEKQYQVAVIDASADCPVRCDRILSDILKEEFPSTTRIAWSDGPMNTPEDYHHRIRKTVQVKEIIQMADEMFLFPRYKQ